MTTLPAFPKPSQIKRPSRPKQPTMGELRRQVYQREKGFCQMCGEFAPLDGHELERGHAHHVRYRSHGGPDESSNLVWVCIRCHRSLHDGVKPCPPKPGREQ